MHVVCLILEYFPLNPVHSRYFPIPPPPNPHKNNVEVRPQHFCSRLNIDHEAGEGGVTMVPNSKEGSLMRKKVHNS